MALHVASRGERCGDTPFRERLWSHISGNMQAESVSWWLSAHNDLKIPWQCNRGSIAACLKGTNITFTPTLKSTLRYYVDCQLVLPLVELPLTACCLCCLERLQHASANKIPHIVRKQMFLCFKVSSQPTFLPHEQGTRTKQTVLQKVSFQYQKGYK